MINTIMFTNKFYSKVYFSTIEKAVQRGWKKAQGRERHHIIPQSLGGSNDKNNLVYLSCREHFLCHWLLVKITEGEAYHKMVYALMGMRAENEHQERYQTIFTARVYEKYRIEHAEYHSKLMKSKNLVPWNKGGVEITDEHRENLKRAALNRPQKTLESIEKTAEKNRGKKRTEEFKLAHSLRFKGKPKGPQSDEHRLAISLAGKGIKKKEGHSTNVANAVLGNISINKDNTEKKVKKDTLQSYLDDGWQLGGKKRKIA
jgi:rubrerythrin